MKVANSGTLATASGSKFQLQRPVDFPDHAICERIRIECATPVRNNGASARTPAASDIVALFGALCSSLTLAWGDKAREMVDNALPSARLRELNCALVQRDFWAKQAAASTGYEVRSYSGTSIAAGATDTIITELHRPFVFERLGSTQSDFAPGPTQMRALDLSFVRGAAWTAFSGDVIENGATSVTVIFDIQPSRVKDRWARVIRLTVSTQAGLSQLGPDDGGAMLAVWEYTSAAASTALGLFSLLADGIPIHDTISAERVTRDEYTRLPLGGYDLSALATPLLTLPDAVDLKDTLVAGRWQFSQAALNLNPPQIAWCHVPAWTEEYRDGVVGPNILTPDRREAKLVTAPGLFGATGVPPTHAAVAPCAVLERSSPAFDSEPGRLFQVGRVPITHVPNFVTANVRGLIGAAGEGKEDVFARASVAVAQKVPGGTSPSRGEVTETGASIAQYLAPPDLAAKGDFLTGWAARAKSLA